MESCSLCRSDLEPVVVRYDLWALILNWNQDLLGKCFLTLARHEEQILHLTGSEWSDLHDHIRSTTLMLKRAFQPDHFNYVFLQNQDRHVHMHIIPRYAQTRTFAGLEFVDSAYPSHYTVDGPPNHLSPTVLAKINQHLQQSMEQ